MTDPLGLLRAVQLGFFLAAGAAVGSFLNVVAYRLPQGRSVVLPPSSCPSCMRRIRPWENIPVLSWFLLLGRCRGCRSPIAFRYPLVEALSAGVWGGLFLLHSQPIAAVENGDAILQTALWGSYFSVLLAISLIDLDHFIVPDVLSLPLIPLGIAAAAVLDLRGLEGPGFPGSVVGACMGGGAMLLLAWIGQLVFGREALGAGDIKLMAAVGAWQGAHPTLLTTVFVASLLGSLIGIAAMARSGRRRGARIPFGPYLCLGAGVAWLWGNALWAWVLGGGFQA